MIYFVSAEQRLFSSTDIQQVSVEESLYILEPLKIVGLDTETQGFSPYLKNLLLLQLGCYDFQVVIDATTIDIKRYKEYLESSRLFLGWNIKFDLKFLFHNGIIPRNVYDGYLMEKTIWQGWPSGMHSLSLKSAGEHYCNVELDKSVRGKILWSNTLSDDIITYAANDVKYLEIIREKQIEILSKRGQQRFLDIDVENKAVLPIAYFEYCGVKIDVDKWKNKMNKDLATLNKAQQDLDNYIVDFYKSNIESISKYCINQWYDFNKGTPTGKWYPYRGDLSDIPECPPSNYDWNADWKYITREFPFIDINYQGDLFEGFDFEPKCTVNWNSAKQVIPLLEFFGFNLLTKDKKTGAMKKSVEATIIEGQKNVHPIAEVYLQYKAAQKVVSTYGQNVLDLINPVTHRIHTNFNQIGTDTFRLSSGGGEDTEVIPGRKVPLINLQNMPADADTREAFVCEPGNKFISIDFSGEESVILANISGDKAMIDLFTNGCGDLHSLVAKMVYKDELKDIPVEKVKELRPDLRKKAKAPEFQYDRLEPYMSNHIVKTE